MFTFQISMDSFNVFAFRRSESGMSVDLIPIHLQSDANLNSSDTDSEKVTSDQDLKSHKRVYIHI